MDALHTGKVAFDEYSDYYFYFQLTDKIYITNLTNIDNVGISWD